MSGRRSTNRRRSTNKNGEAGRILRMSSPSQATLMKRMVTAGPLTIVLVFSPSCPHCHTYMPLWKELERERAKKANLVSVRADIYDKTPMGAAKPVESVPTVLFVDPSGKITEASEPRNLTAMRNTVRTGSVSAAASAEEKEMSVSAPALPAPTSEPIAPILPGTSVSENPLPALPATPVSESSATVQSGGNPWAAFLMAARQAAPAAVLLGAYTALPKRSSGLGAARGRSRSRRRLTRKRSAHRA